MITEICYLCGFLFSDGTFFALGNPLLDINARVELEFLA
ncbi:unnamed protein product, partial [Rotaria sp. Silwood2]